MNLSPKEWGLLVLVLALGVLYVVFFSDWFRPKIIPVQSSVRSLRMAWSGSGQRADLAGRATASVTFALPRPCRLTDLRVVSLVDLVTNSNPLPLWHLVAGPKAAPVKNFVYGAPVPGMTDYLAGAPPRPLEPGVTYRLLVEAGAYKGTNDFRLPAAAESGR